MKIGKYEIHYITSGYFALDGGAMFGIIPKPLWEKTNSPDSVNRIKLATRNLLLISDNRKLLIDTGMGEKWDEKSRAIYDIKQDKTSVESQLEKLNIRSGDITDVILTHLHFDHTGGSTRYDNGKLIPAFPNAKYYVQRKNYEWACNPSERDRGSYIKDNFVPLMKAGVLNYTSGDDDFDDEIKFVVINGHTFAQQLLKISDSSNTLLFCGDLFPTVSHIPLPYVMGYDLQPLVTVEEKKNILSYAAEENWKLFFEHDADTAIATITTTDKGYKVNEKFNSF